MLIKQWPLEGLQDFQGLILTMANQSEKYYSVGVEDVMDGKVPSFVTNEADDPPQLHLKDIVGTTTLWDHEYLVLADIH
jgi:hypothetical protein